VFLPLFVASIAVRAGMLSVGPSFEWIGATPAIVLFGTATVVEIVGFLVPWVDHALDLLAAPLAAIAGAVLMTSQLDIMMPGDAENAVAAVPLLHPAVAWSLGIIVGAMTASGVEAASIAGRVSSSVLTIGWLNPIYGMAETVLALLVTLLAVWVPVLVGVLVLLLLPIVIFAVWRILAWRRKQRRAHEQKLQQARERIASSISHHAIRMGAAAGGSGPVAPA
jgi:hypothetical protein